MKGQILSLDDDSLILSFQLHRKMFLFSAESIPNHAVIPRVRMCAADRDSQSNSRVLVGSLLREGIQSRKSQGTHSGAEAPHYPSLGQNLQ